MKNEFHDDEYYYKIVRKNIRKFRMQKNVTHQELADKTDLSRQYLCDVENDNRNKHITISSLGRIADALNVDIFEFFK